jgi:hypothetical protein
MRSEIPSFDRPSTQLQPTGPAARLNRPSRAAAERQLVGRGLSIVLAAVIGAAFGWSVGTIGRLVLGLFGYRFGCDG